ncbi:MAG: cytochrome b/b6 domain-containing protein [Porphyrobacter sp.]|jgi:thiosulfate reductase cytochrome b subunit|nr:cytochrome b/b6 domain-containing protein [Porphyrobacter sp.]
MSRHALSTRLWHWLNAGAAVVLFMSGLTISNAHRRLYWGDYGFDPAEAWAHVIRFPGWLTLPARYNLAAARDWHNTAALVFAFGLLAIWVAMLANGHFRRDIAARPQAAAVNAYKPVQKVAYGVLFALILPLMVATGLAMSPGIEPAAPWLVDGLGGRQSARSLHFITTWLLVAFVAGHVAITLVSGPVRLIGAMVHGGTRVGDRA